MQIRNGRERPVVVLGMRRHDGVDLIEHQHLGGARHEHFAGSTPHEHHDRTADRGAFDTPMMGQIAAAVRLSRARKVG